ncbi:MAG TPA: DUF167 domain-containing protein [Isosphaeraceae bacterium]|jgi:hypothetical protein|nr:DUF167 domain-containing protein [Isosphaeraceae bacterium]
MISLTAHPEGTILAVRAQPGSRKEAILGEHAGALRVAVQAAPERGKANAAIARLLADACGCRVSQVMLLSGDTTREKRFLLAGVTPDVLRQRLAGLLAVGSDKD